MNQHRYKVRVDWTGNDGRGTESYKAYRRDHVISIEGKPELPGSSDAAFRGDPSRYTPEDMLVASLSTCHMLWFLHLCAVNGISVLVYRDQAEGVMNENPDGSGEFVRVTLKPVVKLRAGDNRERALELHHRAHAMCFIARSVNFAVEVEPEILFD